MFEPHEIQRMTFMLEALMRSQDLLHWIGGYAYGHTSKGDPYIALYASSENYDEKICRVYPLSFKWLPQFIDTSNIPPNIKGKTVPSKETVKKMGIYHECPRFEIALHLGKMTPMGPEKRFFRVLRHPSPNAIAAWMQQNGRSAPTTRNQHSKTNGHATPSPVPQKQRSGQKPLHFHKQHPDTPSVVSAVDLSAARAATKEEFYNRAFAELGEELYKAMQNVAKMTAKIAPDWNSIPLLNSAMMAALTEYRKVRLEEEKKAKKNGELDEAKKLSIHQEALKAAHIIYDKIAGVKPPRYSESLYRQTAVRQPQSLGAKQSVVAAD